MPKARYSLCERDTSGPIVKIHVRTGDGDALCGLGVTRDVRGFIGDSLGDDRMCHGCKGAFLRLTAKGDESDD